MLKELRTLHKGLEACEQSCMPLQRHSDEDSTSANVLSQAEEFLIERLVSEETRIALDFKSSELRKIAQEERQKVADMRRAEAAFALASKAAAAAQQQPCRWWNPLTKRAWKSWSPHRRQFLRMRCCRCSLFRRRWASIAATAVNVRRLHLLLMFLQGRLATALFWIIGLVC